MNRVRKEGKKERKREGRKGGKERKRTKVGLKAQI